MVVILRYFEHPGLNNVIVKVKFEVVAFVKQFYV